MSRSLNKAILIGNLGHDPEVRTTGSGKQVAHLSVATERQWTDREGNEQKRVEWHRVIAWDKLAEIAEQYLSKGERVYVEGEIQYRSYEDGEGITRYVTEINARDLIMLGSRPDAPEPAPAPAAPRSGRKRVTAGKKAGAHDDFQPPPLDHDDDMPF
jgi:single-strand DNA-binding protein